MTARWADVYGHCWQNKSRQLHGAKAEITYADQMAVSLHIVALPEGPARPPGAGRLSSFTQGFSIRSEKERTVPDLCTFASLEFAIVPLDFSWTMIHTHEDHAFWGPCFVRVRWAAECR